MLDHALGISVVHGGLYAGSATRAPCMLNTSMLTRCNGAESLRSSGRSHNMLLHLQRLPHHQRQDNLCLEQKS